MKKLLLSCSIALSLCAFGACGGEESDKPSEPDASDVVITDADTENTPL